MLEIHLPQLHRGLLDHSIQKILIIQISVSRYRQRVQSLYPFASTARRFIPESIDDDEDNDDDGEEIDLMEFLGA